LAIITALLLIPQSLALAGGPASGTSPGVDLPTVAPGRSPLQPSEENEDQLLKVNDATTSNKLAGDSPLSVEQAGAERAAAAQYAEYLKTHGHLPKGPATFSGAWSAAGPQPIYELGQSSLYNEGVANFVAMNGRIGALAIRADGTFILGGAQGGIWTFDGSTWTPRTDNLPSLAIGALAIAPSNDSIVYAGTGEGALSGDSYFGNGILKSTNGGTTWSHVSGNYFVGVSVSRLVVDPTNSNHLFAAVLRGRGGARRVTPPIHSQYGIWESRNGGVSWHLIKKTPNGTNGATDLEMDPQNPRILYASFWQDQVYKSTDGGHHWTPIMNGLPSQYNVDNFTRFSIAISHPSGQSAVLYAGTDFIDSNGDYQLSRLFRSDDQGGTWNELPTTGFGGNSDDSVLDYCGGQCFYDNVVEADPTNPDIVYAGGQFNYGASSGGIYRSDDGGQTWKNLGWDLHPDYHALAFDPNDPNAILIGSDGGVWYSPDGGGRLPGALDEGDLTATDWQSMNGGGLQIGQFTSIATNPMDPGSMWGGLQDNGTELDLGGGAWLDMVGGDGGQVLVDPTDANYVYGTYYNISPWRIDDGGTYLLNNSYIRNGINLSDRSGFYVPFALNQDDPSQLFLGTYRLYRTDNAKAPSANDVLWHAISPDLTDGCTGTAPNGAASCTLSAIGVGGGDAVYTGSLDGRVYLSTDAQVSSSPSWDRIGKGRLPNRPVASIAVDRSNYRIAYIGYNGYNAATRGRPGHVFKTTDGGEHFKNISGNLPDSPVNSVVLDPAYPNTIYVGTDVGPFVTYDGGHHWNAMGSGFPIVSIWQLDLDPSHRTIAAGTHGRGVFTMDDNIGASAALVVSKVDAGIPVGPSSNVDYTITVRNIGNADATGVKVTDPIPDHTTFVSAADGGTYHHGKVSWIGLTVAAGASVDLHFTVNIKSALKQKVKSITNDGISVTSAEGPGTTGSPTITPIAPPYAVTLTSPLQFGQERSGNSVDYALHLANLGFNTDSFSVNASGTFPSQLYESDCSTTLSSVGPLAPGDTTDLCLEVTIPGTATNNQVDTTTVTATSAGDGSVSASVDFTTVAALATTLLVDNDDNNPDVQSIYADAMTAAGVTFNTWDLKVDSNLPQDFLDTYSTVVWFTGNSYPGPILPYEGELTSFLDGGGNLFMSGQDILDQTAGTTDFVKNYLHIDWDGSENQNDKSTAYVTGVSGNPVTGLITDNILLDHNVLQAAFEDQITPNGGALAAFVDDGAHGGVMPDALTFAGTYKVMFLAFPFEAYGAAGDRATLMGNAMSWFAGP
jgi:uncharacterized repeat protein (TIGR01451 family)